MTLVNLEDMYTSTNAIPIIYRLNLRPKKDATGEFSLSQTSKIAFAALYRNKKMLNMALAIRAFWAPYLQTSHDPKDMLRRRTVLCKSSILIESLSSKLQPFVCSSPKGHLLYLEGVSSCHCENPQGLSAVSSSCCATSSKGLFITDGASELVT